MVKDDAAQSSPSNARLSGTLGVGAIVFMVIAQAAPLTVMVANTPLMIGMGNGIAAPLDAALGGVIMLLFAIGFVAMSAHITNAGAFYAYIQKGLGRIVGLGAAALAIVSYFCILLALEAYIGFALSDLIRAITGKSIPWQPLALMMVLIVGVLGYRNVELSAKFLGVALLLEIAVVLVVDVAVAVLHLGNGIDLAPISLTHFASGSPGLGVLFAIFSFAGFEATAVYREEARDPSVTIPRATYISVVAIGVFYVVSMWCEIVGIGYDNVVVQANTHPGDMYQILTAQVSGPVVAFSMRILLLTSLFACVLSIHNVLVRYKYVMGRAGVLHPSLGRVHKMHGAPHIASLAQTGMSLVAIVLLGGVLGLDPVSQIYAWGATSGTIAYIAILALTCVSVIVFFSRAEAGGSTWKQRVAPGLALIGLVGCLVIAVVNLPSLVGGNDARLAAQFIVIGNVIAFVVGVSGGLAMRARSPKRYAELGQWA